MFKYFKRQNNDRNVRFQREILLYMPRPPSRNEGEGPPEAVEQILRLKTLTQRYLMGKNKPL